MSAHILIVAGGLLVLMPTVALAQSVQDAHTVSAPKKKILAHTKATGHAADPETIVVTSSRRAERLRDVPESVSVVSADRIRNSAAQTLDGVLRNVPSITMPSIDASANFPNSNKISMRGLSGTRALVLLDGLPLNDSYFGTIQWNRVPMENVRQIEIVRGGDATLWGNYAMGGVINILTRSPTRNELSISGGGGSYGTYRSDLYAAWVPTSWAKFSVNYGYNQTLGYDQIPTNIRRVIDRKTEDFAHNVSTKGEFDITPTIKAGVTVNYNQNYQPIQITSKSSNYFRSWTYSGHVSKEFAHNSSLTLTGFHSDSFFKTNNTATPPGAVSGTAEYVENSHHTPVNDIGSSLVWESSIGKWVKAYSLGLDVHELHGTDNGLIFSDPSGTPQYTSTDVGKGRQIFVGGYGQVRVEPVRHFDVMFSARYQYYKSYDAFQSTAGVGSAQPDHKTYSFLPRLSLRYGLGDHYAIRAAAYEAFRAPTMDELYRNVSTPTGVFLSNPALFPEKLKGVEAGFDVRYTAIDAQVTGFYNHIENLITSRDLSAAELPAGIGFGTVNINAGSGESRGMEAEVHWRIARKLRATIGYTYSDSPITHDAVDPTSVGNQQSMVPHNTITASVTYTGDNGWKITPQARYMSTQWGDSDHTLKIPAYFVMDLTASYPITQRIEAFGQLQNLFDRHYVGYNDGGSPAIWAQPFTMFGGVRLKLW